MKLNKNDISKIILDMANTEFDENGFIVDGDGETFCNVCGEGYPVKDIGLVWGQITCINCADNIGEELQDRGQSQ